MTAQLCVDRIHAPASADPVCQPPTHQEVVRRCWASCERGEQPPQDGRSIIACGRVIYDLTVPEDSFEPGTDLVIGKASDPFVALIHWTENDGQIKGWHYVADGLSVARTLTDEVLIDFWLEDPR